MLRPIEIVLIVILTLIVILVVIGLIVWIVRCTYSKTRSRIIRDQVEREEQRFHEMLHIRQHELQESAEERKKMYDQLRMKYRLPGHDSLVSQDQTSDEKESGNLTTDNVRGVPSFITDENDANLAKDHRY
ncbi:hypothetical protein ACOME3_001648 [Neoechinorhynchus agilis]